MDNRRSLRALYEQTILEIELPDRERVQTRVGQALPESIAPYIPLTADGRILKLLHVVDEHTREALAICCGRRIESDATVAALDRLVAERGDAPAHIRCDNGPELTANALRDWCRFSSTRRRATSSPARRGRTPTSSRSGRGSATSCPLHARRHSCPSRARAREDRRLNP